MLQSRLMPLTGKQRRYLRAQAHSLPPVVQIGKEGVTDPVIAALDAALTTHELVKAKLVPGASEDRHDAGARLATATGSELVQVLGRVLLFYRRRAEDPTIELP